MTDKPNDLLLLAGKALALIMQFFLALGAIACVIALPLVIVFQGEINAQILAEFGEDVGKLPLLAIIGLIGLIIALLGLAFVFFGKLRAIIGTVGEGDPFAPINAVRLELMAWIMLACQVIILPIGGLALFLAKWAEPMENVEATIDVGIELEGLLLVVILFILARVFKHGAEMREDLEGTV
ncbi:MAG: DUF2975 domain-containing protein [Erythrobacter sp.]|uniref:DUF2975 domain-containing protein n=1 Tax=Erythrobacter sp. TaxID=1042 RepID=UPI002613E8DD|nr:DUF2975 domain-containing protein [Erythrobacter sp.]MDJ0979418.1 DUF2975 domain-containing protein [Erythrobacter sp.]